MYTFTKQEIGGFAVFTSEPEVGDLHRKKFLAGVTPLNQATLNIYVSGGFRLECGSFQQDMIAGQTSLDIELAEFPAGALFCETVTQGPAKRLCVSKIAGGPWLRDRVTVDAGWLPKTDGVLVFLDGEVAQVQAGVAPARMGGAIYCRAAG